MASESPGAEILAAMDAAGAVEKVALVRGAPAELWADRDFMLQVAAKSGHAVEHASAELRADRELMLQAAAQNGLAMKFASPELRADRGFMLQAAAQHGCAVEYASAELQADPELKKYLDGQKNLKSDAAAFFEAIAAKKGKGVPPSPGHAAAPAAPAPAGGPGALGLPPAAPSPVPPAHGQPEPEDDGVISTIPDLLAATKLSKFAAQIAAAGYEELSDLLGEASPSICVPLRAALPALLTRFTVAPVGSRALFTKPTLCRPGAEQRRTKPSSTSFLSR